ncbi:MAG: restriction endonuclease subunit S [Eubacteriales bacterium]|nr:restriction endonuclease subunit S [Eubacteriales bacterium]
MAGNSKRKGKRREKMKIFSASTKDLQFGDRLVPAFYYYTKVIKQQNMQEDRKSIVLGKYSTISDGEHSHISRNKNGGVRYLYGRNIKEGVIDFDEISDDPYINPDDYEVFSRCHIKQKDVLIAIYGTVGKSAVYRKEYVGEAGIPRHISNISLKENAPITPEYLTAYFRSKAGKWQMFSLMTGNIQQLLSLKNLREFEIPVLKQEIMALITENEKVAIECEIQAHKYIKQAQELLYEGLKFDIKEIEHEFCFGVPFSELKENNLWSTNYYDRLFVKTAESLKKYNGAIALEEIVEIKSGDEVGSENYHEFIQRKADDKPFIRTSDIVNWEADLYPDYYVAEDDFADLEQDVRVNDVLFTKDGKIGCVGMITEADHVILASGIERLRVRESAQKKGITPEYLFTALSLKEIGRYAAIRRMVVASTIPHLREERLKEIEIPLIDGELMKKITKLVKQAFTLKAQRKTLLKKNEQIFESYF